MMRFAEELGEKQPEQPDIVRLCLLAGFARHLMTRASSAIVSELLRLVNSKNILTDCVKG